MADKGFSLPTAQEVMENFALAEAEKASAAMRRRTAEAEMKSLLEQLAKPSGLSDEEALRRVTVIIERAVSNGLTEVQVYRPQHALHRSRTRHQSAGARLGDYAHRPSEEMFRSGSGSSSPRGYKIKFQIVDFPNGMPGMSASR